MYRRYPEGVDQCLTTYVQPLVHREACSHYTQKSHVGRRDSRRDLLYLYYVLILTWCDNLIRTSMAVNKALSTKCTSISIANVWTLKYFNSIKLKYYCHYTLINICCTYQNNNIIIIIKKYDKYFCQNTLLKKLNVMLYLPLLKNLLNKSTINIILNVYNDKITPWREFCLALSCSGRRRRRKK